MATLRQNVAPATTLDNKFRALLSMVRGYRPNDDLSIIERAYHFSLQHHQGQTRASGEPYLIHPLEVATVLAEMKLDPSAIAAGLPSRVTGNRVSCAGASVWQHNSGVQPCRSSGGCRNRRR